MLRRSLVSAIPSQVTQDLEDTLIPWMLTRSIPSHLARNEGHRVHGMVVLSTVEHIFHGTAMHPKATAGNHLAEANRASHGLRVLAKESARRVLEKSEGKSKSKNAKGSCKGKTSKADISGIEKPKSETNSETQESAQGWMA